ncbi:MAG: DUF2283 domain-containing protein [Microgenomates group bacterium]
MKKTKIFYDKQIDAVYINLKDDKETHFEEIEPNIIIEYNKENKPIAIEILNASSFFKKIKFSNFPSLLYEKNKIYKTSSK